jgi:S1-C subfamily serine protease
MSSASDRETSRFHRRHAWSIALLLMLAGASWMASGQGGQPPVSRSEREAAGGGPEATEVAGTFRRVAQVLRPSVVSITSLQKLPSSEVALLGGHLSQEQLKQLLKRQLSDSVPPDDEQYGFGLASGIVLSSDGYILTNYHVVRRVDQVTVHLPGDESATGCWRSAVRWDSNSR